MKPSCWTPPARLCYEGDRPTESFDCDGAIAGPATPTAAAHSPAFFARTRADAGTRHWLRRRRAQGGKILAGRQSRSGFSDGFPPHWLSRAHSTPGSDLPVRVALAAVRESLAGHAP